MMQSLVGLLTHMITVIAAELITLGVILSASSLDLQAR